MFDLANMNFEQLSQLELAVKKEKDNRRAQEEETLLREFRAKLQALGLSADDMAKRLGGGKGSASGKPRLPGMYRDANNPENTWSGRGRKPLWVLAWLEQGRSLDELKI